MPPRALQWSSSPRDLMSSVIGRQPVAFSVRAGGLLGALRRDVRVALVPLEDIRHGGLLGDPVNAWLAWQSLTGRGVVTRLPCDVGALADAWGVARRGDGIVLRAAVQELFDVLYEERRL